MRRKKKSARSAGEKSLATAVPSSAKPKLQDGGKPSGDKMSTDALMKLFMEEGVGCCIIPAPRLHARKKAG